MSLPFEQLKPGTFDASNKPLLSKFDFTQPGKFETFDNGSVIGMTGLNTTSYADHALQQVWSEPINDFAYPNDFNQTGGWFLGGVPDNPILTKINETDWKYVEGTSSQSRLYQRRLFGLNGETVCQSWEIPKSGNHRWIHITSEDQNGTHRARVWFDIIDGIKGSQSTTDSAVILDYDIEDRGDHFYLFLKSVTTGATGPNGLNYVLRSAIDNALGAPVPGAEFMIRNAQLAPVERLPFQDNNGVAALDNWGVSGGAVISLVWDEGKVRYKVEGPDQSVVYCEPGSIPEVPHTMAVNAKLVAGDSYALSFGGPGGPESALFTNTDYEDKTFTGVPATPTNGRWQMRLRAASGNGICYFDFPEMAEGQKIFGLKTYGASRHLIRRTSEGRLNEPAVQNKCLNYNVAPTDLSNMSESGSLQNQQIVTRGQLVGNLTQAHWDSIEAEDPDKTFQSFIYWERGVGGSGGFVFFGTAINTNTHNYSFWGLGDGDGDFGPNNSVRTSMTLDGKFKRYDDAIVPGADPSSMSVILTEGGSWGLIAGNQMTEGAKLRSLIPVGGSTRTRSADKPLTPTDGLGIDRRRNGTLDSRFDTATLGEHPSPGTIPGSAHISIGNGWTAEFVGKGKTSRGSYIDIRCHGNATGSFWINNATSTEIVAEAGQDWLTAFDVSLLSGDISGLDFMALTISERDASGTFLTASATDYASLISSTPRRFYVSRSFTDVSTAHMNGYFEIRGTGTFDFVIRIADWSNQQSIELLPHVETTGTAIEYKQWEDGLTVVDEWDTFEITNDFDRWWSLNDGQISEEIEIRTLNSSGAALTEGYFSYNKDGVGDLTGLPSSDATGLTTFQAAFDVGNIEYWQDGTGSGPKTITNPLPNSINTLVLGSNLQVGRTVRDGIQKSIAFYGYRATEAIAA